MTEIGIDVQRQPPAGNDDIPCIPRSGLAGCTCRNEGNQSTIRLLRSAPSECERRTAGGAPNWSRVLISTSLNVRRCANTVVAHHGPGVGLVSERPGLATTALDALPIPPDRHSHALAAPTRLANHAAIADQDCPGERVVENACNESCFRELESGVLM
jgi:hypothetical protein